MPIITGPERYSVSALFNIFFCQILAHFCHSDTVLAHFLFAKRGDGYMLSTLTHHGVKGQKWGIQNGPPYPIGKNNDTVFVSGSSKTQDANSPYYRKELPKDISNKLDSYMSKNKNIIVGDAPGIDRQVQDYLNSKNYSNVEVYGPGKQVRYTANSSWKTNPIDAPEYEEGSKEWLAKKDIAMSKRATEGLAVILDEGAKATRKNIDRLLADNKDVVIYQLNQFTQDGFVFVQDYLDRK